MDWIKEIKGLSDKHKVDVSKAGEILRKDGDPCKGLRVKGIGKS